MCVCDCLCLVCVCVCDCLCLYLCLCLCHIVIITVIGPGFVQKQGGLSSIKEFVKYMDAKYVLLRPLVLLLSFAFTIIRVLTVTLADWTMSFGDCRRVNSPDVDPSTFLYVFDTNYLEEHHTGRTET